MSPLTSLDCHYIIEIRSKTEQFIEKGNKTLTRMCFHVYMSWQQIGGSINQTSLEYLKEFADIADNFRNPQLSTRDNTISKPGINFLLFNSQRVSNLSREMREPTKLCLTLSNNDDFNFHLIRDYPKQQIQLAYILYFTKELLFQIWSESINKPLINELYNYWCVLTTLVKKPN